MIDSSHGLVSSALPLLLSIALLDARSSIIQSRSIHITRHARSHCDSQICCEESHDVSPQALKKEARLTTSLLWIRKRRHRQPSNRRRPSSARAFEGTAPLLHAPSPARGAQGALGSALHAPCAPAAALGRRLAPVSLRVSKIEAANSRAAAGHPLPHSGLALRLAVWTFVRGHRPDFF